MNTQTTPATKIANLSFARGKVGERYSLETPEQEALFATNLTRYTRALTITNTADCGDERETISLADGTDNPAVLRDRIIHQLFGGQGLAVTKALVAANAVLVRDAKSFWQAYEITSTWLHEQLHEDDAGHDGCGASNSVEASVANPIDEQAQIASIGFFVPLASQSHQLIQQMNNNKQARLEAGFYNDWDPQKHKDYLISRFPHNFSYLNVDPNDHETHGHNGSGVYVVTEAGQGFAKNAFNRETGQSSFAVTLSKMKYLAHACGTSDEERLAILLAFADDTLHVGAGIVTAGMPVFAQAA